MERRLNIARTKTNKDKRDARDKTRDDSDWSIAADALTKVEASKFDLKVLNKPQLQSLVRVLKAGNANGKKDALAGLLVERFGTLSREQFEAIKTTVNRGVAVAALPAPQEVMAAWHSLRLAQSLQPHCWDPPQQRSSRWRFGGP